MTKYTKGLSYSKNKQYITSFHLLSINSKQSNGTAVFLQFKWEYEIHANAKYNQIALCKELIFYINSALKQRMVLK